MASLLTATLTVSLGVVILLLYQIVLKGWIDPLHELDRCSGEVLHSLILYEDVYSHPGTIANQRTLEASHKLREQSAQFCANVYAVKFMPHKKKKELYKVSANLMNISNSLVGPENLVDVFAEANQRWRDEIYKILKMPF